jgi:GH24 family phage-related lysozyme (muramidase)
MRLTVYADSRGLPTVGIGHLVRRGEGLTLGAHVTPQQVEAWFAHDVQQAVFNCQMLFASWQDFPAAVQEVLANMMFNLGASGLARFRDLRAAVARHDWQAAADAMVASAWYHQVGERSQRLVAAMRSVQA